MTGTTDLIAEESSLEANSELLHRKAPGLAAQTAGVLLNIHVMEQCADLRGRVLIKVPDPSFLRLHASHYIIQLGLTHLPPSAILHS